MRNAARNAESRKECGMPQRMRNATSTSRHVCYIASAMQHIQSRAYIRPIAVCAHTKPLATRAEPPRPHELIGPNAIEVCAEATATTELVFQRQQPEPTCGLVALAWLSGRDPSSGPQSGRRILRPCVPLASLARRCSTCVFEPIS